MADKQIHRLEAEHVAELPARQALSPLIDPSLTSGLLAYGGGAQGSPDPAQTTTPTTGPVPAQSSPTTAPTAAIPTQSINSAVEVAQSASAQGAGATAQNVDSANSQASASTTS